MSDIRKAVIPIAGRATRFLPLSRAVPKELFPLGDKPLLYYVLRELADSGVEEVVLVVDWQRKLLEEYFTSSPKLAQQLAERKETALLADIQELESVLDRLKITFVQDTKHAGPGHAIFAAAKHIGQDPVFAFYPDDIFLGETPAALQLAQAFKTSQRPILGLAKVAQERLSSYGVAKGITVTNRVLKLQTIMEKPAPGEAPSDLAVVGRSIITPEVLEYVKKRVDSRKAADREVRLTEALGDMVQDGKVVYGYELKGEWLECGDKKNWMKSFMQAALRDERYGKEIGGFLKGQKLV